MTTAKGAVLVVEDDADIRDAIAGLLEDEGYRVQVADNGRAALDVLAAFIPQVIVLDLMMPVMSGEAFREEQLGIPRLAAVPVLVISAAYDGSVVAARMKADGFMAKPIRPGELLRAIARFDAS